MTMIGVTLRGIFRDRVFQGILVASLVFLAIPSISTLSMRQVTALTLTLSLSLVSFILLLLAIFLGGVSLWRDMERRYTHSVLTLPMSRSRYLLGRFAGISLFLLGTAILLGLIAAVVVFLVSTWHPPDRAIAWGAFVAAVGFDVFKCIMLVSIAALFSSVSTSFFLPVFGTIAVYLVGGASQQAFDYVHSTAGQTIAPVLRQCANILYYILPNFSAFNLKVNAIYALPLNFGGLALTAGYGVIYTTFVLLSAAVIFARRELG